MNIAYATQRFDHETVKWVFTLSTFGDCKATRFYGFGKGPSSKDFESLDEMINCIDWYETHGWTVRIPIKAKSIFA